MEGKRFIIFLTILLIIGLIIVYLKGGIDVGQYGPIVDPARINSSSPSSAQVDGHYGVSVSHPLAVEIGMNSGGGGTDAAYD